MGDSAFLVGLVVLTSAIVLLAARRLGFAQARALRSALVRLVEWAGMAAGFYALNLAVGVLAVLVVRTATRSFVSVYIIGDGTLPVLSALQAVVLQWWRAESGGDEA
jgi:hypothetical protein